MSDDISFDDLYPSRFLKAGNLHQPTTYTIERVYQDFELQKASKKPKPPVVFSLKGCAQELVACKTVGICVREMFGSFAAAWQGKRITLYAGKVEIPGMYHGKPAVRVLGSPDLERDKEVVVAFAGKPPFTVLLRATGERKQEPAKAAAPKREHSPRTTSYLQRMGEAKDGAELGAIEDQIAEDNELSSEETQLLGRALKKRETQLSESAG